MQEGGLVEVAFFALESQRGYSAEGHPAQPDPADGQAGAATGSDTGAFRLSVL